MVALRRTDLQSRAQSSLESSQLLLTNHRWSDAYHLAGYAVELGLKACIAKQMGAETIPDKEILKGVLSHSFSDLVGLAGLRQELKDEQGRNSIFAANWAILNEWSTDSRYEARDPMSAQLILSAIDDPKDGIWQWIRKFW